MPAVAVSRPNFGIMRIIIVAHTPQLNPLNTPSLVKASSKSLSQQENPALMSLLNRSSVFPPRFNRSKSKLYSVAVPLINRKETNTSKWRVNTPTLNLTNSTIPRKSLRSRKLHPLINLSFRLRANLPLPHLEGLWKLLLSKIRRKTILRCLNNQWKSLKGSQLQLWLFRNKVKI